MLLLSLQNTSVILFFRFPTKFSSLLTTINVGNALTDLRIVKTVLECFLSVFLISDGTDLVEGFLLVLVHFLHYQFVCTKYTLLLSLQYSTLVN